MGIDNPEYKGEWKAKMITNPDYKGEGKPKQLDNEKYAPDTYGKFTELTNLGFELWIVNAGSIYDNILVTDDLEYAKSQGEKLQATFDGEKEKKEAFDKAKKDAEA